MAVTTVLLLAVLFIAGLVNIFFRFPTTKLLAWFQSLTKSYSTPTTTPSKEKETLVVNSISPQPRVADQAAELKQVFATFDKNSDGFITKQELKESLKNIRIFMSDAEVEEMVKKVDANGDGLIDFDEFCMLCGLRRDDGGVEGGDGGGAEEEEEELKEAFGVFDKDKDGLISVEELAVVLCSLGLREGNKVEDCKEMVKKVDMDGDGMVNFDEFKRMMKGGGLLLAH